MDVFLVIWPAWIYGGLRQISVGLANAASELALVAASAAIASLATASGRVLKFETVVLVGAAVLMAVFLGMDHWSSAARPAVDGAFVAAIVLAVWQETRAAQQAEGWGMSECPNCHFDCTGIPRGRPCPECGFDGANTPQSATNPEDRAG